MTIQLCEEKSGAAGAKFLLFLLIAFSFFPPPSVASAAAASRGNGIQGISLVPSAYNMGTVFIGSPKTATFTISNTGRSDVVVTSIKISTDKPWEFHIDSNTCRTNSTIKAGKSCSAVVMFTPVSEGAASAKLLVDSNAAASPTLTATLTAVGAASPGVQNPASKEAKPPAPTVKSAPALAPPAPPAVKPGQEKKPSSVEAKPVSPRSTSAPAQMKPASQAVKSPAAGATSGSVQERPASAPQAEISVKLAADKASPALVATVGSVTFTAHATGGSGKYEYRFWLNGPSTGNVWKVARDYGASDAYAWIPVQQGSYSVWVYARDAAGGGPEASSSMTFDILRNSPAESVEITADKSSPALRATIGTVTFIPHAFGGSGAYEYKFWLKGPSTGNEWKLARNYGISDKFEWAPMQAGHYLIWVYARNAGSQASREAAAWTSFDVVDNPPARGVSLTPDRTSPVPASAGSVTFIARARGGSGTYEYEFWLKGPSTKNEWQVVREYAQSNRFLWSPDQAGAYSVAVYARNTGSPAGHEAVAGVPFDVTGK